jgi:hypothetical protein
MYIFPHFPGVNVVTNIFAIFAIFQREMAFFLKSNVMINILRKAQF